MLLPKENESQENIPLKMPSSIGHIIKWGSRSLENAILTPNYLIYTRAGHIPHLTWDLVAEHLPFCQNSILQLTLPTMQANFFIYLYFFSRFDYQNLIKISDQDTNNFQFTIVCF